METTIGKLSEMAKAFNEVYEENEGVLSFYPSSPLDSHGNIPQVQLNEERFLSEFKKFETSAPFTVGDDEYLQLSAMANGVLFFTLQDVDSKKAAV